MARRWGGHEHSRTRRAQIESAVEAVGKRGQVAVRILRELECMVAPAQAGLQIAEHGVDPLELGHVLRLAAADDGRSMRPAGGGHGTEAGQLIGEHGAARGQMRPGSLADRVQAEARDGGELGAQGAAVIAERDGGDERDLILRSPAGLAPAALTAQVSIIDLNRPVEDLARLAFDHRLHQLVADDQRGLMQARLVLEQRVGVSPHPAASDPLAARATKPRRPARLPRRRSALRFSPVTLQELGDRQSAFKRNSVHCHGAPRSR